jgi:hypothetical protein
MPASPITALTDRRVLNRILDKRIKPYTALYNLLFPPQVRENLYEETVQIDVVEGSYGMAPFVKVGTKAVMMDAQNGTSYTLSTPFINIKRPLTYSTRLAKRIVGGDVFTRNPGLLQKIIRQEITKDMDYMNVLVDNRLEWMASQIITGTLDYAGDGDKFQVLTGKPSGNTYQVSTLWTAAGCTPLEDIFDAKKIVSGYRGPIPNIGICGANAAKALRALLEAGSIKTLDSRLGVDTGRANLLSRISEDGMVYIGNIGDVDFWQYLGTFVHDTTGVVTPLIRDDYIEYFSTAPAGVQSRKVFFGLIPDLRAILSGNAITERYIESKEPGFDQDSYEGCIKSRPFPWLYRPEWQVSQKVA